MLAIWTYWRHSAWSLLTGASEFEPAPGRSARGISDLTATKSDKVSGPTTEAGFEDDEAAATGAAGVKTVVRGRCRAIRGGRKSDRLRRKALDRHTGVDRRPEGMVSDICAPQAPAGSREGLSPLFSE
jgi:hypothetical protein